MAKAPRTPKPAATEGDVVISGGGPSAIVIDDPLPSSEELTPGAIERLSALIRAERDPRKEGPMSAVLIALVDLRAAIDKGVALDGESADICSQFTQIL